MSSSKKIVYTMKNYSEDTIDTCIENEQSLDNDGPSLDTVNDKDFSKNSIIKLSRKAGIKCISECAIQKIKNLLNKKIDDLAGDISSFYASKNSKTIDKEVILKVFDSKKINYCT